MYIVTFYHNCIIHYEMYKTYSLFIKSIISDNNYVNVTVILFGFMKEKNNCNILKVLELCLTREKPRYFLQLRGKGSGTVSSLQRLE